MTPIHVSTDNPWFMRFRKSNSNALRLFCFSFAGSSASAFRPWIDGLPGEIEIIAVQLPGRENRLREPCLRNMVDIVANLRREILPYLELPFAVFGHSLGSLIAYELLLKLQDEGHALPELFFASGSPAPHTCTTPLTPRRLSQEQILKDLAAISGEHLDLLKDPEVLKIMIPMLQADFEVYANYGYRESPALLCPIIAIRGEDDAYIDFNSQSEWKVHTECEFTFHVIPGGHLFMVDSRQSLIETLATHLKPLLASRAHPSSPKRDIN